MCILLIHILGNNTYIKINRCGLCIINIEKAIKKKMANKITTKKGVRQDGVSSDDQDSDGLVGESFWKRICVTLILVPLVAFVLR